MQAVALHGGSYARGGLQPGCSAGLAGRGPLGEVADDLARGDFTRPAVVVCGPLASGLCGWSVRGRFTLGLLVSAASTTLIAAALVVDALYRVHAGGCRGPLSAVAATLQSMPSRRPCRAFCSDDIYGRSLLTSVHATRSIGAAAIGLLGSAAATADSPKRRRAVGVVLGAIAYGRLLPDSSEQADHPRTSCPRIAGRGICGRRSARP